MDKALQTMINNLPEKTGKTLAEWIVVLNKQDFKKHSEAVNYLKSDYGVTHGFANTIVALSKDSEASPEQLISTQYNGKEVLIPIYDALLSRVNRFGNDIIITPKKSSVSVIRKKQFALIKPATKTRIDLGLKLNGKETIGRLESSGPFGTMCTHRVKLTSVADVDDQLNEWLIEAYDQAN